MTATAEGLRGVLREASRFLFFTGKGGVGKTSLSTACALGLADAGKRVLLVSTDAASNLDEMLGVPLRNRPVEVPGVSRLSVLNIDPNQAAEDYRQRVLAQLGAVSDAARDAVREELSGACTTEIAAFDEFATLLAGEDVASSSFDHVVFDTAPTGHTLRLLSLPKLWTGFLDGNDRGASCLGPHSGLKMQEARFRRALEALTDARQTTLVLVTTPEVRALSEAARTSEELSALGVTHQRLLINCVFHASSRGDVVAVALEAVGQAALASLPEALARLPRDEVGLRPFDTVGLTALRALLEEAAPALPAPAPAPTSTFESLGRLVDALEPAGHGLVMVMGKGGVGKTTLAAAVAVALARRGHVVQLTTTDPAAHVSATLAGAVPGLEVSRIDPAVETGRYVEKIMSTRGRSLDDAGRALLREDLRSPCTEEVAVFHAFSRVVSEARRGFVVLDTAPTGHSLLLIDAAGAYHRQTLRDLPGTIDPGRVTTPLMRLQDPALTRVIIVTVPETTPVSQASALQDDLRRAKIEPFAWVMNRSLLASGTRDALLASRLANEQRQLERVADGLARRLYVVPWVPRPPVGPDALFALTCS